MKAIVNANVIMNNDILKGHTVLFDEKILGIAESYEPGQSEVEEVIDGCNKYLSPGFIDIHIHGCMGSDTMDDNDSSIWNISKSIAATGVTAFLPTTMTMKQSMIEKTMGRIRRLIGHEPGASLLGCNLEGPFISDEYKGAHEGRYIRSLDFPSIEGFYLLLSLW